MEVIKLHRYVSRMGPISTSLALRALEAAENEGWPIVSKGDRKVRVRSRARKRACPKS